MHRSILGQGANGCITSCTQQTGIWGGRRDKRPSLQTQEKEVDMLMDTIAQSLGLKSEAEDICKMSLPASST